MSHLVTLPRAAALSALTLLLLSGCGSGCKQDAAPEEAAAEAPAPTKSTAEAPAPEADPALTERCTKAFEHMLAIMEKEGTPADIVGQFRKQTKKSVERCAQEAKKGPEGQKMLDCMLAAQTNADVLACSGAPVPADGKRPTGQTPPARKAPAEKAPARRP